MTIDQDPVLTKLQQVSLSDLTENGTKHHAPDLGVFSLLPERESEAWQRTIKSVVQCVVSVKFAHPYSFDTEDSKTSEATGFVADAERG